MLHHPFFFGMLSFRPCMPAMSLRRAPSTLTARVFNHLGQHLSLRSPKVNDRHLQDQVL